MANSLPQPAKVVLLMPWGRVGSNLLLSLMTSSFESRFVRAANEPLNRTTGADAKHLWFSEFYGDSGQGEKLVASKHAMRVLDDLERLGALLADLQVSVVRMRRSNLVKVAVSHLRGKLHAERIAREEGVARWGVLSGEEQPPAVPLDPEAFVTLLRRVAATDAVLARFRPDCPMFDIEYERLRADSQGTCRAVLEWLGLTPDRQPSSRFRKATPDRLADAVPNLQDLRRASRRAGFEDLEPMFDE